MLIHNTMITFNSVMGEWIATNMARGIVRAFKTFDAAKAFADSHVMG